MSSETKSVVTPAVLVGVAPRSAARARVGQIRIQLSVFLHNKLQRVAVGYIVALVLVAVLAPVIVPHSESISGSVDLAQKLEAPSLSHPFGTDEFGRDVFSRVLYGARISLLAGCATVGCALLIGVPLGALAGALGGFVDTVIMRVTDIFLSFPSVLLAITIAAVLGPNLRNAIIALAVSWWPWYTRLVRGQATSLKERQFVRAAIATGAPTRAIVFRHVLPNSIGPTVVMASLDIGATILTLAALSFLGLGAQPPIPEWGLMVNTSRNYFTVAPWVMVFPGLAITLTVLAFNVVGDGVRELLDPKSRTN